MNTALKSSLRVLSQVLVIRLARLSPLMETIFSSLRVNMARTLMTILLLERRLSLSFITAMEIFVRKMRAAIFRLNMMDLDQLLIILMEDMCIKLITV